MTQCVFGKSTTRQFVADDGQDYLDLPSQVPSIFLFSSFPSADAAINGSGAFSTINYWIHDRTKADRVYTIPAILDPEPTGAIRSRDYYEAINFILESGGQIQTKVRSFEVHRADGTDSRPSTTKEDILDVWPGITAYINDYDLSRGLIVAETELRMDLEKKGLIWGRIYQLDRCKYALGYKVIANAAAGQVAKGNSDKFTWIVDYFTKKYNDAMAGLELPHDRDADGKAEEVVTPGQAYSVITR
jgi:hypothetical protein